MSRHHDQRGRGPGAGIARDIGLFVLCLAAVVGAAFALDRAFPPDLTRYHALSTTVSDRDGRLLRAYLSPDEAWRFPVETDEVSPLYLEMLIAVEDRRFPEHAGVDPFAAARATYQALTRGRIVSGASTLTMQTARLLEPRPRTLPAKIVEMARALQLEWRYSKDEILRIYLTLAPYGGNLEGVRAASLAWFGKEPRHLTVGESALLVALPQAPNGFRPDRSPTAAFAGRSRVLDLASQADVVRPELAAEGRQEPLPTRRRSMPLLAGIATDRLVAEVNNVNIISTLEIDLQTQGEKIIAETAQLLGPSAGASALVAEVNTGAVLVHIGSADYLDPDRAGMVDQTTAVRSPGSALKPFIYAMTFDNLLAHPNTVITDRPRRFGAFAPVNFDRSWVGDISLHDALRLSLNGPAVALLDRLAPGALIDNLAAVGTPLVLPPSDTATGLAIALGGVGTSLESLVTLYAAIARAGTVQPLVMRDDGPGIRSETSTGDAIKGDTLMGPAAAWYVTRSLSETPRPLAYRADGHDAGRSIAFKTGTSHGYRDGWAIGYSGDYIVGVWVGRPDGRPCPGCSGIGAAAPAMFALFDLLPADQARLLSAQPPPNGAITGGAAALPERLRRFDAPSHWLSTVAGGERRGGPRIDFPVSGTEILLSPVLPVRVAGGSPPFHLLVNGVPVPEALARTTGVWHPDGPGSSVLTVVDSQGRTAQSRVEILAP